jgi:transposase
MTSLADSLPDDPATLKAMLLAERARADRLTQILKEMQRHRFGRRAETLPLDQLELGLEDVQQEEAAEAAQAEKAEPAKRAATASKRRTNRGALPAHLPRIGTIIDVEDKGCPCCSGALHLIDEDRAERLDIIPAQLRVLVVRRPKYACRACEDVVIQAPAPARLIEGGIPTEATVAHVVVAKYADHLPLYRQAQIYARQGIQLDRSTLADWTGRAAFLLRPVHEHLLKTLRASSKLFADETTAPVLDPGRGRTKTGQLWAYARDDRPWGGADPPAVAYVYAPDRKAERPMAHLAGFKGVLQVDGYAGYRPLAEHGQVRLAFCWAHLWMPPLLQGSSELRRHDKRLQSSIRPSHGEHPAAPAVMVRSADRAQSRDTSSKLDAPSGLIRSRLRRSPSHAHCPSHRISRPVSPAESLAYAA